MVDYNFRYSVSTARWLKRLVLLFVLFLFCSVTKIIPIDIQTQIITNRVSSYVHLSKLEVHKDSHLAKYLPQNQVDNHLNIDFKESIKKEGTKKIKVGANHISSNHHTGEHVFVEHKIKASMSNNSQRQVDLIEDNFQNDEDETIHLVDSASKKSEIKEQINWYHKKKTCQRMRMELGGDNQKSILTSFGKGRLGNKLASFASTYAISQDFGLYNYISENQYRLLSRVFDLPRVKEDKEDSPYYIWRKYCGFNAALSGIEWKHTPYNDWRLGLDQMKKGKYVKVSKWINDIKGYFPYIKTLRNKLFRFRKHDVWNAKKIMSKLNPENYTMVSIHVRLTDYKEHLYKLYHFKKYVQTDYFKNAMEYFATKYTNVLFYIISDDIKAAKYTILTASEGKYKIVFPGAKSHGIKAHAAPTDLVLLSLADHSILTYGTYGMWGALLAKGGETIMSKDFLRTDIGTQIATANLTNWKVIE